MTPPPNQSHQLPDAIRKAQHGGSEVTGAQLVPGALCPLLIATAPFSPDIHTQRGITHPRILSGFRITRLSFQQAAVPS